jgi:hypothetical protein
MFQNSCTEMAVKLNRIVHSPKKARYFAGFFSLSFLSICALTGWVVFPSGIQNPPNREPGSIMHPALAPRLSFPLFSTRH